MQCGRSEEKGKTGEIEALLARYTHIMHQPGPSLAQLITLIVGIIMFIRRSIVRYVSREEKKVEIRHDVLVSCRPWILYVSRSRLLA